MTNSYSENIEVEVTVNEIIWGNNKMDVINGYDKISYTTLKLKSDYYTIMVFNNNFNNFKDIEVGYTFKAVIKLWKNNVYNFVSIIKDHPKLISAKKEFKTGDLNSSIIHYNEYFKTCDISLNSPLPLGIFTDCKMYIETLILHFKLNISETNPYYNQFEQTLEKCYEQIDNNTYSLKKDVSMICSHFYNSTLVCDKYKGEKVLNILNRDPEYIFSLIIDTDDFCLHNICFVLNDFREVPNFSIAFEINCIKLLLEKEEDERVKAGNEMNDFHKDSEDYGGFDSWDESVFKQVFEEDDEAWNSHYQ